MTSFEVIDGEFDILLKRDATLIPPRRLTAAITNVAVTLAEIVPIAISLRSILLFLVVLASILGAKSVFE
jgi:hypothetical protein